MIKNTAPFYQIICPLIYLSIGLVTPAWSGDNTESNVQINSQFCDNQGRLLPNGKIHQTRFFISCSNGVYLDQCTQNAAVIGAISTHFGESAISKIKINRMAMSIHEAERIKAVEQITDLKSHKQRVKEYKKIINEVEINKKQVKTKISKIYWKEHIQAITAKYNDVVKTLPYKDLHPFIREQKREIIQLKLFYEPKVSAGVKTTGSAPKPSGSVSKIVSKNWFLRGGVAGAALAIAAEALNSKKMGCAESAPDKINLNADCNPKYDVNLNVLKFLARPDKEICEDLNTPNVADFYSNMYAKYTKRFDTQKVSCSPTSIDVDLKDTVTKIDYTYKIKLTENSKPYEMQILDKNYVVSQPRYEGIKVRLAADQSEVISFSKKMSESGERVVLASDFETYQRDDLVKTASLHTNHFKLVYPNILKCCKGDNGDGSCDKIKGFSGKSTSSIKSNPSVK